MYVTSSELADVEHHLNKLQRKFNLLSSYLQLKFKNDAGFPASIFLDFRIPTAYIDDIEVKQEEFDHVVEHMTEPVHTDNEFRIVDTGTFNQKHNEPSNNPLPSISPQVDDEVKFNDLEAISSLPLNNKNSADSFCQVDHDSAPAKNNNSLAHNNPAYNGQEPIFTKEKPKNSGQHSIKIHVGAQQKNHVTTHTLYEIDRGVRIAKQPQTCQRCGKIFQNLNEFITHTLRCPEHLRTFSHVQKQSDDTVKVLDVKQQAEPQISLNMAKKSATTPRTKMTKWTADANLQATLAGCTLKGDSHKKMLQIALKQHSEYKWSLRSLQSRLQFFNLRKNDPGLDRDELMKAVQEELDGPGRILGYRLMHKRIRTKYGLRVTRAAVYSAMTILAPHLLEQRRLITLPKN